MKHTQMVKQKTTSDNLLVKKVEEIAADSVADAIATSLPGFNIAYKLAKAYTGRGMELRKQRALEWVEFVHDNLGAFSQELFEQEEFQDCFVLLFEAHIKERASRKRLIHQRVLLHLTHKGQEELARFELERLIQTTTQITYEALNVLDFIKAELLDKIEKDIQEQMKVFQDKDGVEGIRLEDVTRSRILVSEYIDKWIYQRYGLNSEEAKSRHGYTKDSPVELHNQIAYEEHLKRKELTSPLFELANLGILIKKDGSPTFGGTTGAGYSLSEYGYKYIAYLNSEEK